MAGRDIKLTLPDGLVREGQASGLLTPYVLERLPREELHRRQVDQLFEAADRLAKFEAPPLSEAEMEAEVQAARRLRRATDARRG